MSVLERYLIIKKMLCIFKIYCLKYCEENNCKLRAEKAGTEKEWKARRDTESDNITSEDYLVDASA